MDKTMEQEIDNYINLDQFFGTATKGLLKGQEGFNIWKKTGDHPNNSIIENGRNTEKSPGDLRRLAVNSNSSKNPSANADVKNPQGVKVIIINVGYVEIETNLSITY